MSRVGVKRRVALLGDKVFSRLGCRLIPEWRLPSLQKSEHIAQLFQLLGIDCVLDVGANIGQYREFLRLNIGYTGSIISFEPVSEMFDRLRRECAADPSWSVHRLALGDTDSTARINVLKERTLSSLLLPNQENLRRMGYTKYLRETEIERTEQIAVRRLDAIHRDILPAAGSRVFLKSDTQGYDMAVIRGASGCLDRILGVQIELSVQEVYAGSAPFLESVVQLTALGFAVTGFFPVQRDPALRIINVDCVMIRDDEAHRLQAGGRGAPNQAHLP